jgi:GntR family transcriptional regulator
MTSRNAARRQRALPANQRLSNELRRRLHDGEFAGGERLPTEAELEQEYGLSRQTVRRAFLDLVAEGLVRRTPGRGTFAVRPGASNPRYARTVGSIDELMEWDDSEVKVDQEISLRHDADIASRLGLDSPVVAVLSYRRMFEGAVFGMTQVAVGPEVGRRLIEEKAFHPGLQTVIRAVDRCLDGAVAGVQQTLTAIAAPEHVAEVLGIAEGSPVLYAERLFFDNDEQPVELSMTHYHPDRYSYRLEIRGRVTIEYRVS